jgi:hypothetical protein
MATPQISLPAEMQSGIDYSLPPDAKSFNVRIQPSNVSSVVSTYTPQLAAGAVQDQPFTSQQILFDFPAGASPSQFLDTRMTTLNFDALFEITTAGVAGSFTADSGFLRSGSYSFFDNLRVVAQNGNVVEEIQNLDLTYDLLCALQMNNSTRDSVATQYGFASDTGITNQGHAIQCLAAGNHNAATTTKERHSYSIPLLSSVLGVLNDKMLNIGRTSKISLVLTTASVAPISCTVGATAFTTAPVVKITLGNFSITADYIDIGLSALQMLDKAHPDGVTYSHGVSYRSTSSSLPATSGAVSLLAGIRASSVKSLFCRFQELGTTSTTNSSNGRQDSKAPPLNSINFNIGGLKVPQSPCQPLLSPASALSALQRAVGSFNNSAYQSSIPVAQYCKLGAGATAQGLTVGGTQAYEWNLGSSGSTQCQFFYGENLEVVSKKNILSGMNCTSAPIFVEMNIASVPTNAYTVYTIAMIDTILVHNTRDGDISVRV